MGKTGLCAAGLAVAVAWGMAASPTALAYDSKKILRTCRMAFGDRKTERERCIANETVNGKTFDELAAGPLSATQKMIISTCTKESPDSYSLRLMCMERLMDTSQTAADKVEEIKAMCEKLRKQTGGSYQVKETCIKAELEAMQRLGE